MHFYGNIQKVDTEQRMVFGYASTEATDAHGEIILKDAIEAALDDYMQFANIREMHQLSAVGTAEEASIDDTGLYLCAHVVDDVAWGKVTSGVYKGFSVGGKVLARDPDDKKTITKILLTEISLVDRPSNPEARFDVYKAAGAEDPLARAHAALDATNELLARVQPSETNVIMKALQVRDDEIDRLRKRVAELESQPRPRLTASALGLRAISKEEDQAGIRKAAEIRVEDASEALAAMSEEDRALLITKAALRMPRIVRTEPVAALNELAARGWNYDS